MIIIVYVRDRNHKRCKYYIYIFRHKWIKNKTIHPFCLNLYFAHCMLCFGSYLEIFYVKKNEVKIFYLLHVFKWTTVK